MNERLVLDRSGVHAFVDTDALAAPVVLKPGENSVLVEVGQGPGGWGLSLRFVDKRGGALNLGPDGLLVPAEPLRTPARP